MISFDIFTILYNKMKEKNKPDSRISYYLLIF